MSREPVGGETLDIDDVIESNLVGAISDGHHRVPSYLDFKNHQKQDPRIASLLKSLRDGSLKSYTFFIRNGLLYRLKNCRPNFRIARIISK